MVEIFKTNVTTPEQADRVLQVIRATLVGHDGNFDLQDCDHILRVTTKSGIINPDAVIKLVTTAGAWAEVLEDEFERIEEALQMP